VLILRFYLSVAVWLVVLGGPVWADEMDRAEFASNEGLGLLLGAGVLLPLADGGADGGSESLRAIDSLVTTVIVTEGLKALIDSERPDGSGEHDSFPSGHAAAAFSVAALQADLHPDQAPLWYAGAAAIAASRVKLKRHRIVDTLAGAALGIGIAQLELSSEGGLALAPVLSPNGDGFGVQLTWNP
jgi:membrane-associated phospholipid phosphatase